MDLNISVGDSFLWSHLYKFLVASCEISFLVKASGLYSKSERSVQASFFLVAIFISSIILFNLNEVRMLAVLLQGTQSLLGLRRILNEVLHMGRSFFPPLELPSDIHTPGCMPLLQVVLEHEVFVVCRRIVQCAYKLVALHLSFVFPFYIILIKREDRRVYIGEHLPIGITGREFNT